MRWLGIASLAGCTAGTEEIPDWQDNLNAAGECPDDSEVASIDQAGSSSELYNSLYPLDFRNLPDPVGTVVQTESAFFRLMDDLYFASYPIVDFTRNQVAFVWAEAESGCGLTHSETHVKTTTSGKNIVEVTLQSVELQCEPDCNSSYLVLQSVTNSAPADVCLKILPGCAP